jgi:Ras-related protein Rab-32
LVKEGLVNNAQQMDDFCKEKGFAKWFETSAKENINIEASSRFLISEVNREKFPNRRSCFSSSSF